MSLPLQEREWDVCVCVYVVVGVEEPDGCVVCVNGVAGRVPGEEE